MPDFSPERPIPADVTLQFMRSVSIAFNAKGLKPNTRVYPFFDGQDVSSHCRTNTQTSFGGSLVTDALGELTGVFRVPAQTFKTGTRLFVLTNNSTNPEADTDCRAITTFTASGTVTYDTGKITSTRAPNITFARSTTPRELSVERTVTVSPSNTSFKDPIAQTFFVAGNVNGIFTTKVDVYFKTRPTDPNVPITLQIRETTNGNPGEVIVPFSTVTVYPKDVNVSVDASAPTQFTFSSPVYLKNDTEYAIVLLPAGGRDGYTVWTAELGQTKIGTDEIIDKQPASGRLYVSSNSVNWTVSEEKDLKFTLYRANFTVSNGSLLLKNKKIDYLGISSNTVSILVGDVLTGASSGAIGTVKIYDSTNNVAHTEITSGAFTEGETVNIRRVSGGSVVGSCVVTLEPYEANLEGKLIHKLAPGLSYIEFNDTNVSFSHKIYNSDEVEPAAYTLLKKEALTDMIEEKTVYSYSYEADAGGLNLSATEGSVMIKADFSTSNNNVSPVVDISKSQIITYENVITSLRKSISGTSSFSTSSTTITGNTSGTGATAYINQVVRGSALRDSSNKVIGIVKAVTARDSMTLERNADLTATNDYISVDYEATDVSGTAKYHSRYVNLPGTQASEDLVVFLDALIPAGTDVLVYAKIQAPGDASEIESRPWTRMTKEVNQNTLGAGDYVYKFVKNGHDEDTQVGGLNSSGVFQYENIGGTVYTGIGAFAVKIVFTSVDSYFVPEVYSMRALALMA